MIPLITSESDIEMRKTQRRIANLMQKMWRSEKFFGFRLTEFTINNNCLVHHKIVFPIFKLDI